MIDRDLPQHPWGLESPEGHPEDVLHLRAERNCGTLCQREYKWTDDDGRQHRRPRVQVVEDAEVFDVRQIDRSEEHTSELQSLAYLVCRLLLEKKKNTTL